MFAGRKEHMDALQKLYSNNKPQIVLVHGHKRVGKTELLREFVRDKRHLYLYPSYYHERNILNIFMNKLADYYYDDNKVDVESWEKFFNYLYKINADSKSIIIIDNINYILTINTNFMDTLISAWKDIPKNSQLFLILMGDDLPAPSIDKISQLGKRDMSLIHIHYLGFKDVLQFFPTYNVVEKIRAYSVVGGVPAYLQYLSPESNMLENIDRNFLSSNQFLYQEAIRIISERLREPSYYFTILETIGGHKRRMQEIVELSGLSPSLVSKYLDVLRKMRIVERAVPVTEKKPNSSKKGMYWLPSNYLKFWFSFIYPNMDRIEIRETKELRKEIARTLDGYIDHVFPNICSEFLRSILLRTKLFSQDAIFGSWWDGRNSMDVTVMDKGGKRMLYGSVKWKREPFTTLEMDELKRTADKVRVKPDRAYYALFSRGGFTKGVIQVAKEEHLLLYTLDNIEKVLMAH